MDNLTISIIIPVYNSESTIFELVETIINQLNEYPLEIILVNDCSSDNSEKICIQLNNKYSDKIKCYSLAKNFGEHNAVMAALNESTGAFIVIMDDDFQNPISEDIKLVEAIKNTDVDVVYTYYKKKEHSFFRNLGSRFNNKMSNIMLKKPDHLYLSSFKVLNRFLVNEIIKYKHPFPYIDGLILRTTSKIGKIEVKHDKRTNGESGYTLIKLVSLWSNMVFNFSVLPLRIAIVFGFFSAFIGFLFAIITFIEKLHNPNLSLGYSIPIILITIFSGVLLISIGIVGEYLGRMFLSQTHKPQYVIRKRFEKNK
jgi:undecaprenyl-phosphate 4-deoxy-4-formamido-L-arabinose transferase